MNLFFSRGYLAPPKSGRASRLSVHRLPPIRFSQAKKNTLLSSVSLRPPTQDQERLVSVFTLGSVSRVA
ncbi:hypothetical protein E2C01_041222 [Portunus trituberculatus]|uniref:Uncharacterized protein n=1 Tax=Portunus trituberculatus TaxID=210409 RepID=A0A5B7FSY6_PORTR|nr:hypothetical protein [Portunus trituberculatus]